LADDPRAVQQFFQMHCPLEASMRIEDAHFWSPAQAGLLRAALSDDAEWAVAVDQLSLSLRSVSTQRRPQSSFAPEAFTITPALIQSVFRIC
jgi:hypothetical protein